MKKTLLENFILPVGDFVTKGAVQKSLNQMRGEVQLSEEALAELQKNKLQKLLSHANAHATYYKNLQIGLAQDPVAALKQYPILTKRILREQAEGLLTVPKEKLIQHSSSGSSGEQSTVYWSDYEQSLDRATQLLWWEWAGYHLGNPVVQTGMSGKRSTVKALKDFVFNIYYLRAFTHTQQDVIEALKWAQKQEQPVLGGYASSLSVIADYAREAKIDVQFKSVISWGDKMFDHYRKNLSEVFNAKVFETYGTAEGPKIASQYDLDYMYIMNNNVYLELLDDNGNEVPDGEMGHVVVTNLNFFSMPLIRYKLGDLAIKLPRSRYPENRKLALPLLQKVIGRDTDIVKTQGGQKMTLHTFTGVIEYYPQIRQFCVVQEHLSGIVIKYIKADNFTPEVLHTIKGILDERIKEPEFKIEFQEVDFIPPTKSGKPQLVISKLPKS